MFTPITNPYIVGNPIKTKKMFYGREDDFEYIRRKLESGGKSYIIVLSGERRSGKTSILFQILNGRLGDNFIPILIDMQTMAGLKNEAEFFEKFALETIKNLDDSLKQKKYDFHSNDASPYKVFSQLLNDIHATYPKQNKLFLIDEYELIETKSTEGSLSPNFIPFLSGVLESDLHISFIFTGSKTLQERGTSFWQNLFGKSLFRNVSFLSEQDTFRLITEPVKGQITYDEKVLDAIYRLTSGQPFYTQIVGQNIVDFVNENERTQITLEDLDQIVNEILENPLPQMIYFWNSLPQSQMLMLSLLAEILDGPETEIKPAGVLKLSKKKKLGLELDTQVVNSILESLFHIKYVTKTNNGYSFQIDLMRQWIKRDHSIWRVMKDVDILAVMQSERPTTRLGPSHESKIEAATGAKKWLLPAAALIIVGAIAGWLILGKTPEVTKPVETLPEQINEQPTDPPEKASTDIRAEQKKADPLVKQSISQTAEEEPAKQVTSSKNVPPARTEKPDLPGEKILSLKEEMLESKLKAQNTQAPVLAKELFSDAESAEQDAEVSLAQQAYETAGEKYTLAGELYEQAAVQSADILDKLVPQTDALRQKALSARSKLGAEHRDLEEYKNAETLVAEAESYAREKNFTLAQKGFNDALLLYERSLTKRDEQSEAIRAAIGEYIHAIEKKNIDQASKISESYRAELKSQWAPFFKVAEDIKIDLTINDIIFSGNSAIAAADIVLNYSGAGGTGSRNEWKFELSESGSKWLINKISEAN